MTDVAQEEVAEAELFEEVAVESAQIATVNGEAVMALPQDLYIPPDALEVALDTFEGPLDLLLYLIRKENLDILDIPIAEITRQYMEYVEIVKVLKLELAADYLVMAAMLAEIKSRMLLPKTAQDEEDEGDPRMALVRRLQEYERFKQAAEDLDSMPRLERDIFEYALEMSDREQKVVFPDVNMDGLMDAFHQVLIRAYRTSAHTVAKEPMSVRERMSNILERLQEREFAEFHTLFPIEEGKLGVVITFVAILELVRQAMIQIVQSQPFSPIHIKVAK